VTSVDDAGFVTRFFYVYSMEVSVSTPPQRICVYCGSKRGKKNRHRESAITLGHEMARRGIGLIYGGGHVGLMGDLATAVMDAAGHVTGVIPRALMDRELGHEGVTELLVVDDMHERKATMARDADAFIALAGGYGTLEELFEVVAWAQLDIHDRPVGLLNTNGYYDHLLQFLDSSVDAGFLRTHHRNLLKVAENPIALLDELIS
jgi:hypothetical protein